MAFRKNRWDEEAQKNGKWLDYDGGRFCLAALPNIEFTKGYVELKEKYEEDDENPEFKSDLNRLLAKSVLRDWEDYVDEEDNQIPYSVEEGVLLLEADEPFSAWLFTQARNEENYKREVLAKRIKK